ncbi:MAG: hypothetical protein MI920_13440 [Kiloniellales bacterium]|nr:hypothetical protein [Kiloniellales bacterium]
MQTNLNWLVAPWRDRRGLSSVEHALLLALVAGGIAVAAGQLGTAVENQMTETADCIDGDRAPTEC